MRRSYKLKYEAMIDAIESEFNGDLQVISQAAGLNVTVKWDGGISENEWSVIGFRECSFGRNKAENQRDRSAFLSIKVSVVFTTNR